MTISASSVARGLVPDEDDLAHLQLGAFVDDEDDVLLAARQALAPPLHAREEVALVLVVALERVGAVADLVVVVGAALVEGQLVAQRPRTCWVPLERDRDVLALLDLQGQADVLVGGVDAVLDENPW